MILLSFPDVNVWLALAVFNHIHHGTARNWWNRQEGTIAFLRVTQVSVLRLLTTAAAMGGKPLTLSEAWDVYDKFFLDDRVAFLGEAEQVELEFRGRTSSGTVSPKLWADALLLASVAGHRGQLITFDQAMLSRGENCLVLR